MYGLGGVSNLMGRGEGMRGRGWSSRMGLAALEMILVLGLVIPCSPSLSSGGGAGNRLEIMWSSSTAVHVMHPAVEALRGGSPGGKGGWSPAKKNVAGGALEITLSLVSQQQFGASSKFPPKEVMDLYRRHGGRFNPVNKLWEFGMDKHSKLAEELRNLKPVVRNTACLPFRHFLGPFLS